MRNSREGFNGWDWLNEAHMGCGTFSVEDCDKA